MKCVIGLTLLVSCVSCLDNDGVHSYANVINADKNPPDRICGGVLVDAEWALSSKSCVEGLFKSSQNVIITAGHSEDKEPQEMIKVTMVPVDKEAKGESIVALRLKKPVTKSSIISWARLPDVDFRLCKEPITGVFQPKITNGTSGARGFGLIFGMIFWKSNVVTREEDILDPSDAGSAEDVAERRWRQYHRSSHKESGPKTFKVKRKQQECSPSTGWPLMCDDTVAGIEIGCKLLNANEVERNASDVARNASEVARNASEIETEYVSVYHYMKDIGQLLYQDKPADDSPDKSPRESTGEPPAKNSDEDKDAASPVAHAEEETTTVTSEATVYGGIWKQALLFALTTLLLSIRIH